MSGSRLLIGVASVLAGTTVLLAVFGFVYNPVLLVAAFPFAAATFLLWSHGTGRLEARMRERVRYRRTDPGGGPFGWSERPDAGRRATTAERPPDSDRKASPETRAAARVLGVDPDAGEAAVRAAFREKAKTLHPDAPGGDEVAFRRVRTAYEQLIGRQ